MPRIKIKQLGNKVATKAIHFGGAPERRRLEVGEVVEVPEDESLSDGRNLLEAFNATGVIEVTLDAVTRPLDYAHPREAKLCAPTFKPRGPDEERERDAAMAAVAARMANDSDVPEGLGSPTEDEIAATSSAPVNGGPDPVDTKDPPPATNRRAARRAAAAAGNSGQENIIR